MISTKTMKMQMKETKVKPNNTLLFDVSRLYVLRNFSCNFLLRAHIFVQLLAFYSSLYIYAYFISSSCISFVSLCYCLPTANSSGDLLFGDLTNGKEATKAKDETSPVAPPSLVLLNFPRREFVHLPLPTSFEVMLGNMTRVKLIYLWNSWSIVGALTLSRFNFMPTIVVVARLFYRSAFDISACSIRFAFTTVNSCPSLRFSRWHLYGCHFVALYLEWRTTGLIG